ncbi:MAG TPA: hypothetical protein VHA09_00400 [Nitrososphaera sp.]|nr:hypothetical protein [Nitrososphaera sp.]
MTDATNSSTTTTISLKDKVIVLGCWLGIAITIRIALYDLHWFGSIGAIGITFLIITLFLKSKYGKKHDERFKRVLRYWFLRKFQWVSIGFTIIAILMIVAIESGYSRYGYSIEHLVEPSNYYRASPLNEFEFLAAYADHTSNGLLIWSSWIMVYEDAEYLTFLALVRKGIIFREVREK